MIIIIITINYGIINTFTHTIRLLTALALVAVLSGCGGTGSTVDVRIAPELQTDIVVTPEVVGKDPIKVSLSVKNNGATDHQLLIDGKWKNDDGGNFGGSSDSRKVPAGGSTVFEATTYSKSATKIDFQISPTEMNSNDLVLKTISETKAAVPGYGVSYTATPSLDQIPKWSPKGTANGAPFDAGTILFAPILGGWKLQIFDRDINPLKGIAHAKSIEGNKGIQTIHLNLPNEPEAGTTLEQKLQYGGGYFQIQKPAGSSTTTSWNTSIAYIVKIDEWQAFPYAQGGPTFQLGGRASGRLYICFKGTEGMIKDSFVAGVFEDAPIVYYGNPEL